MSTNVRYKDKEKRSIYFLGVVAGILTISGTLTFSFDQLKETSALDVMLIAFIPLVYVRLWLQDKLLKLQSSITGKPCTVFDLDLSKIDDKSLIVKLKSTNMLIVGLFIMYVLISVLKNI